MRSLLGFAERLKFGLDRLPGEPVARAQQHPFDIGPVAGTIGKCLQHDKILPGAGIQTNVVEEPVDGRTFDDTLLERQCAE